MASGTNLITSECGSRSKIETLKVVIKFINGNSTSAVHLFAVVRKKGKNATDQSPVLIRMSSCANKSIKTDTRPHHGLLVNKILQKVKINVTEINIRILTYKDLLFIQQ